MNMKPSQNCYDLIKHFESLELKAYPDPGSPLYTALAKADLIRAYMGGKVEIPTNLRELSGAPWTIGYGHTKGVKEGMTCTEAQAMAWLIQDAQEAVDGVNKYVIGSITQGQFDALVSFAFNLGVEALRNSTLLKLVNARRMDAAFMEFKKWVNSKGKVLPGLVKRRKAEAILFQTGELRFPE